VFVYVRTGPLAIRACAWKHHFRRNAWFYVAERVFAERVFVNVAAIFVSARKETDRFPPNDVENIG